MVECFLKCIALSRRKKITETLCVRECNYNCAHRLESSTSPPTKPDKRTNKNQSSQPPPHRPIVLRIKSQLISLTYTRHSWAPASLSASHLHQPASPVLSCLQFPSCLRLFSFSQCCLHHALCLDCPSLHLHSANTFLSFSNPLLPPPRPCMCLPSAPTRLGAP